ncbi:hypothetical protein SISSUDRAFT_1048330 [Sistotremastrum suecicum HHB10207 ss-3]|uniref:Uncharacterized protein n=1 Tax=Sistotremastrum suecicum HHB10207 ss-3 TaxID=1314776 RepID=A0A166CL94_9AGAM|nr:hypothetical protein SISSUDRAFT_1048330 [Sistotremastrum suecicum HHB10207 ss-3]
MNQPRSSDHSVYASQHPPFHPPLPSPPLLSHSPNLSVSLPMSMPPDLPDPPNLTSNSNTSSPKAPASSSAPTLDPFDTPLFNRLIGLIEELNVTVKEQRKALEEQTVIASEHIKALEEQNVIGHEQRLVLEQQREVLEDMRNALISRRNIGDRMAANVETEGLNSRAEASVISYPIIDIPASLQASNSTDPAHGSTALPINGDTDSRLNEIASDTPDVAEPAVGETSHIGTEQVAVSAVPEKPDSIHSAILLLNETMKSVKETLLDHGTKLSVLIRDALKGTCQADHRSTVKLTVMRRRSTLRPEAERAGR